MKYENSNGANLGFENKLWEIADKIRGHIDASEYKHVVLRLIFLKYVLFSNIGVGTLGRVNLLLFHEITTICDFYVTVVRTNTGIVTKNFLDIPVLSRQTEIKALGEGSTGQTELSHIRLGQITFIVPHRMVQKAFEAILEPLRNHTVMKVQQSHILTALRDTLLPKLLSGELRLPNTQKRLEGSL